MRTGTSTSDLRTVATRSAAGLLSAAFAFWMPADAAAQPGPVGSPIQVELNLSGGVLVPASTLIEGDQVTTGDIEVSESAAFGGGVGIGLPGGLVLEGQALFAPSTGIEDVSGNELTEGDILNVTAHAIYKFPLPLVKPFFGGGAGFRSLSLEDAAALQTDSESDFTGVLLAGAYITAVPGLNIRAEVRDYLSSFQNPLATDESNLQNDVALLAGLSFSFP